jgi:hypothetical protein
MPVLEDTSPTELRKVLDDFHRALEIHPKKIFVLVYPGNLPDAFQDQIYNDFDRRVFLFEGNPEAVFPALYTGKFSRLEKGNQVLAKRLLSRSAELVGNPMTLKSLKESSLIVADLRLFEGPLFGVSKQFVDQGIWTLSAENSLGVGLVLFPRVASLPNDQVLRQLDEFRAKNVAGGIQLFFDSTLDQIEGLIEAARRILSAA